MSLMVKETGGAFVLAQAGVHAARCCDVVDLGLVLSGFVDEKTGEKKLQHKVRVVWQYGEVDESIGKRPIVSAQYTASLHEKATLRHDLESWRGRPFTPDERKGFDLEKLLGVACYLNVMHEVGKNGRTYANVKAIMPLPKAMAAVVPPVEDYVRVQDRAPEQQQAQEAQDEPGAEFVASDDDVPF